MQHGFQFSISNLLTATFLVALLIVLRQYELSAFLVLQFVLLCVVVETLVRKLPEGLQSASDANCQRANGSMSPFRANKENEAFRKFRTNVWIAVLYGLFPINIMLFVALFVEPLGRVTDVISPHMTAEDKIIGSQLKTTCLIAAMVWMLPAFMIVRSGYVYFLREFIAGINTRRHRNMLRDLQLAEEKAA